MKSKSVYGEPKRTGLRISLKIQTSHLLSPLINGVLHKKGTKNIPEYVIKKMEMK